MIVLGEFSFSGLELMGSQNTTYYLYISAQVISTDHENDPLFGMDFKKNSNEKVKDGTYYFIIPVKLRNCLDGEIFENKTNMFLAIFLSFN